MRDVVLLDGDILVVEAALNYIARRKRQCGDEKCRGTEPKNILAIMHQGLDEAFTKKHLHGPGLYLTPDSCKAMVYSHPDDQDIHAFALDVNTRSSPAAVQLQNKNKEGGAQLHLNRIDAKQKKPRNKCQDASESWHVTTCAILRMSGLCPEDIGHAW